MLTWNGADSRIVCIMALWSRKRFPQGGIAMKRGFKWDKKYMYWGMTAFFVVVAAILFYMAPLSNVRIL